MPLVLIVDDSEDLRDTLEMLLMDEGFDVASACDGRRGLHVAREIHPDAILLDMMMPEMDGLEFLSRLSAEASPPPVIANSGFDGFRAEALRRGAVAFLMKPLSAETLLAAVRSAVERRAVPPAVVAENAAEVEQARRCARETSRCAVARLGPVEMSNAHDDLQRVVRWLPTYFGFGLGVVNVLRDGGFRIEALHGPSTTLPYFCGFWSAREDNYCDDVVTAGSTLLLTDAAHHPSGDFGHPKVIESGVRFYAGAPLTTPSGAVLGTLCLVDTSAHEFHAEDMRVLQALGPGTGRGLETGAWPLDESGAFGREYLDLFVDTAAARAAREGCACTVVMVEPCAPAPEAKGLAVVRLDAERTVLLWCGAAGAWAPPAAVARRILAKVELVGPLDREAAHARVHAIGI
jgi:DNA-binding response OmpR family regulator